LLSTAQTARVRAGERSGHSFARSRFTAQLSVSLCNDYGDGAATLRVYGEYSQFQPLQAPGMSILMVDLLVDGSRAMS